MQAHIPEHVRLNPHITCTCTHMYLDNNTRSFMRNMRLRLTLQLLYVEHGTARTRPSVLEDYVRDPTHPKHILGSSAAVRPWRFAVQSACHARCMSHSEIASHKGQEASQWLVRCRFNGRLAQSAEGFFHVVCGPCTRLSFRSRSLVCCTPRLSPMIDWCPCQLWPTL